VVRRTHKVVAQTRSCLAGVSESAHRLVSLHDVDVRQIRKEQAQVIDNADSVILDHTIGIRHPLYASQSQRRSNASPAALQAVDGP